MMLTAPLLTTAGDAVFVPRMTSTSEDSKSGASTFPLHALVPPALDELNSLIPGYEFLELVDRGGMGVVYKARQKSLNRVVAVKTLPPASQNRRTFAERFVRESHALASLNHPNIVAVYDSGETSTGLLYYVMEFVPGSNLRDMIKSRSLSSRQMLAIVMQVCGAMQYAHDHGVVHRDIKPANILIDKNGNVKVADFGLAKVLGMQQSVGGLTSVCDTVGTPDYIAPEALVPDTEVDHRADIFSLGVMLYEMFTGRIPKGVWEPPSRSGVDARLDEVVSRALQVNPESRYQNVSDLTQGLQAMLKDSAASSASSPEGFQETSSALLTPADESRGDGLIVPSPAPRPASRRIRVLQVVFFVAVIGAIVLWQSPSVRDWISHGKKSAFLRSLTPKTSTTTETSAPKISMEDQLALAEWVFAHDGLVNVQTVSQRTAKLSDDDGFRSKLQLPKEDFKVVRVSFSETESFNDKDMAELVPIAKKGHFVSHLSLRGTSVTARGLVSLPALKDTLTSLNIRNTFALSAQSVPLIGACSRLDGLYVSVNAPQDNVLMGELQSLLPTCGIFPDK
jgi:serine/threonine protein kinase